MIAVLRSRTFGGHVIYQGYVQVDEHAGVPIYEGAFAMNGQPKDRIEDAVTIARKARENLGDRAPSFQGSDTRVGVHRSRPPGRVVYLPFYRVDEHEGVPVFSYAAPGVFPENIDDAIKMAHGARGG
jgi:hypothetical protein